MSSVPTIDQDVDGKDSSDREDELAFQVLSADYNAKQIKNKESEQRLTLRWWSVILSSFLVLIFMITFLHILVNLEGILKIQPRPPAALTIALYVAPLAAMVTLSVTLLFGAFRGLSGKDQDKLTELGMESARFSGIVS